MEENQNPAPEAGDEDVVTREQASETTEPPQDDEKTPQKAETTPQDGEEPPQEEEVSKSKQRSQRRQAYIEGLKSEADDKSTRLTRLQAQLDSDEEPKEADFEDFEDYRIAKVIHGDRQRRAQAELQAAQADVQDSATRVHTARMEAFQEAEQVAAVKYEDYDRVAHNPRLAVSKDMAAVLLELENGPDVLYHLGSNPGDALSIAKMDTTQAAVALGRISATLTTPPPRTETKAPEPITPVKANKRAQKDPSKMTMAEYRAWVASR